MTHDAPSATLPAPAPASAGPGQPAPRAAPHEPWGATDRPLVVKLGGGAGLDPEPLLRDLAALQRPWVLVHGGNAELDELTRRLGKEPRFVTSPSGHTSRVTDPQTIGLIQMSYRGRINNDLVLRLQRLGVQAVGLSGVDGRLLEGVRKEAIRVVEGGRKYLLRDDLTGKVTKVNVGLLRLLLDNGYRPVVTIPALARGDDGTEHAVNVDGDRAAAMLAAALGAPELAILSNVPGLLRDVQDPTSLVRQLRRGDADDPASPFAFAQGRFKKKLLGAVEALDQGIERVVLGTARGERPLRSALAGDGTVIT